MTDDLLSSLKNLKSKLSEMENTYEQKVKNLEKRNNTFESLTKKIDKLVTLQNDIIKIECDGKFYETSKTTIRNCYIDNLLKDKINNYYDDTYYVDLSRQGLKLVLKIMRFYSLDENKDRPYEIFLIDKDEAIVRDQLDYFFKSDYKLNSLIKYIN